jgi:colanic acid/amylovoran biosynthesis glycosyltransferase
VTLLGAGTRELVRDELRAADVFLHAAVSEGFGNAVLEAQACAVAVVCTDADGLSENVVDGITGLVVPRRDRRALAAALLRLAHDPPYRRALGDAGRRRVIERFRPGCQIDAWQQFYETALVGSTGMPADAVGTGGSISAGTD